MLALPWGSEVSALGGDRCEQNGAKYSACEELVGGCEQRSDTTLTSRFCSNSARDRRPKKTDHQGHGIQHHQKYPSKPAPQRERIIINETGQPASV